MQQAIARLKSQGLLGGLTLRLGLLAGVHLQLGQRDEGLARVRDALAQARATGEHAFDAELCRLRGELLRAGGREGEALEDFLRACTLARVQGAMIFELRATVSLARLLGDTGRPEAARSRLVKSLARFDAGMDSVDLREARALLK